MDNANGGKPYIDVENYDANLEKAKQLMADAGYPNGEGFPTITYSTNDAGYHIPLAEYLQKAWAELGITVEVDKVEWSSFTPQRRSGDFEIARNGWVGDYSDPSNMLDLFCTTNGNNDGKYSNADYDAARNEQAKVEGRILELEKLLEVAELIEKRDNDKVGLGSTVKIMYDGDEDDTEEYRIVGSKEADPSNNKISNESPLAKAIMGAKVGDTCTVESPNGNYEVEVLEIK